MVRENIADLSGTVDNRALFLARLREATGEKHKLLESQALLAGLMHPEVSLTVYATHLRLMHQIHQSFEHHIAPVLSALFPKLAHNSVSAFIAEDLRNLKAEPADFMPAAFTFPKQYQSVPYALGVYYVLEGSKLGGRVIYKHLQKRLGITQDCGGRFLTDGGSDTGSNWKVFLFTFSESVTISNAELDAIAGANDTFTAIYNYYESNTVKHAF